MMIGLLFCLALGAGAAGYVGYRLYMRNHPAVGVYRMEFPEGVDFKEGVAEIEKVLESDYAVREVVQSLDLVSRFKLDSEEEAIERVREKLLVRPAKSPGRVTVMYLDRSNELALEILKGLHAEFVKTREARAVLRALEP